MSIQKLIYKLQNFWMNNGCIVGQAYDIEKGAGTMNPLTFFGALGNSTWQLVYLEPSRRPKDGRYGENPFRLYKHLQMQVLIKPSLKNIQELYIDSLTALGINLKYHDLRFEEDNWEAPTLGAWGVGWQVLLDGIEITQFTYFQQMGGIDCKIVSAEITYGIERICMFISKIDNVFDLTWGDLIKNNESYPISYGRIRQREEFEMSAYSFEYANIELHWSMFKELQKEAWKLLNNYDHYLSAYECTLKISHIFNILDARGAISTTERPNIIKEIRNLSCACANSYLKQTQDSIN